MKRLALLFWEFSKISLFVIGGGYAIIAVAAVGCIALAGVVVAKKVK